MKIIILSPIADLLFTKELKEKVSSAGDVVIIKDIKPLDEITELHDNEPKIVAIDPDFCGWKITKEQIQKMNAVKAICLQTTSFDWIDVEAAKQQGIPVVDLRGFSTNAVAEWSIMMALNVARKLPMVIKDGWQQDFGKHQGIELSGKKAGIIGLGNIGTRIGELCNGLGMDVLYWSRIARDERFEHRELDILMKEADVVFLTLAKNKETEKILTDDLLKNMKHSALFVSIVHKIYNHELVLQLVKEGKLYGYAFETGKEKIADFQGNIWAGPELAWCTDGSMSRNAELWAEAIVQATKQHYPTQVNK